MREPEKTARKRESGFLPAVVIMNPSPELNEIMLHLPFYIYLSVE